MRVECMWYMYICTYALIVHKNSILLSSRSREYTKEHACLRNILLKVVGEVEDHANPNP